MLTPLMLPSDERRRRAAPSSPPLSVPSPQLCIGSEEPADAAGGEGERRRRYGEGEVRAEAIEVVSSAGRARPDGQRPAKSPPPRSVDAVEGES